LFRLKKTCCKNNKKNDCGNSYYNPVAVAKLGMDDRRENSLQNTFTLRYSIFDWLNFRETVSFQYSGRKDNNYLPYNALGTDWLAWTINKAEEGNNNSYSINTESQLSFDVPFKTKRHVLAGAVTWITRASGWEWMNIQSNKTPSTDIKDPSINAQINYIGTGSGDTRELGALATMNYKFLDRYMLQGSMRADAASSFGINYRWGLFNGISAGWRFSDEPFLEPLNFLGESMLRASWGVSGRQPGSSYARFATYGSTDAGSYVLNPAIIPTQLALNDLRWESISSYDIGIELYMFGDRLYIEADIYDKITHDILFNRYDIPVSSGYARLEYFNGGEMQNRGWELMTDWRIIRTDNFRWSVNLNTSQNINSFNVLPENFNTERSTSISNGDYPQRVIEGEPIGSFFGFRYLGVYPSDADAVAKDADGNIIYDQDGNAVPLSFIELYTFKGGDPIYEDINFDGKIDLNDVVYIGDSNPDFIGGFGTSANYKNLNVSCNFHYRLGFDIINGIAIETEGMNNKNNQSKAVLSRWRVQGQDYEGMLHRAYMDHPANNLGSDKYVEKGDYLRLINFMIAYKLKRELCEKLNLRNVNLALSGRKLLTFTNYSGQDPEVGQDASNPFWIGVDRARTPPPRILTFSVLVGF